MWCTGIEDLEEAGNRWGWLRRLLSLRGGCEEVMDGWLSRPGSFTYSYSIIGLGFKSYIPNIRPGVFNLAALHQTLRTIAVMRSIL